jgi:hypothetical protein
MVLYVVHSFTLLFLVLRYQDGFEDMPDLLEESGSESGRSESDERNPDVSNDLPAAQAFGNMLDMLESDEREPAEGNGLPHTEAFGNMLHWMSISVGGSEEKHTHVKRVYT